ncbi:MAG: hypothetical protein M1819_004585 [Sarea resinae]|nr:MAG: hypothetical protein M1819_006811 [Sarea resinae]KAI9832041.1 MAG: hypothetical protein M1819_004585 [Sarea resinae]
MGDFKLSASLEGHEDDVRAVVFPEPNAIISASRDATVRLWALRSTSAFSWSGNIACHASSFVNSLAYYPPTANYPEGLAVSGGKDTIIDVRRPGAAVDDNAEALLLGHSNNVCALDTNAEGGFIVSGSWDGQGMVWRVGKWECEALLEGHEGSVWAVLAYDSDTIITGCADKQIRVYSATGKPLRLIRGSSDVVRALCRVPSDHPSGAHFASAGNDGIIRLWTLEGRQVGQLVGHESFIYSLASLPTGELVSSGEDRTVRIWRGDQCIQTITHPAISVWSVSVNPTNGDLVSGASDRIVRVFTRSQDRLADAAVIAAFEDSVKSSSIPQQQVGDVNKEKLPGPEFLTQKSGTKEGQVVMIREADGSVTAHQWSQGTAQWISVGTVVDAVGSSGKKVDFGGKEYDYVFDVDIEDGKPPLKLPYNLSQNPYEAATKFIEDNELPIGYLDQVANFITTNTQGATIGQQSSAPQSVPQGADPWGQESRYRPGETSSTPTPTPPTPKVLPQTTYLSIKTANLATIEKKIKELNESLIAEGSKDISLNSAELDVLHALMLQLERAQSSSKPTPASAAIDNGLALVTKLITSWPSSHRLPGLDLLRLLAATSPATATYQQNDNGVVDILEESGVFGDMDRANNIMLAVRTFANLFETEEGRSLMDRSFDKVRSFLFPIPLKSTTPPVNMTLTTVLHQQIQTLLAPLMPSDATSPTNSPLQSNRNLLIALSTLYINYCVHVSTASPSSPSTLDRAFSLLTPLSALLGLAITVSSPPGSDGEALYRLLVATGTLLSSAGQGKEEVKTAATEVFGLQGLLEKVPVREARVKAVVAEITSLLR